MAIAANSDVDAVRLDRAQLGVINAKRLGDSRRKLSITTSDLAIKACRMS